MTLYDIFLFNNIPYTELQNEEAKQEIQKWVKQLTGTEIEERILKDYSNGRINIRTFGMLPGDENYIIDNIPEDLFSKATKLVYPIN